MSSTCTGRTIRCSCCSADDRSPSHTVHHPRPLPLSPTSSEPHRGGVNATGLRRRALRASVYTLAAYGLSQGIRLSSNLILTRLLVPDMFGVMAIALVLITGLALFSDIGLSQIVVQHRQGAEARFSDTVWSLQTLRGLAIGIVVLALACLLHCASTLGWVPAGSVYANPLLPLIVGVLALSPIVGGLESTKAALARRELAVGSVARLELGSQLIGSICTIGLAVVSQSIWALVAGAIASVTARTVMSHTTLPGAANRWHWDLPTIREILRFGKWIVLSSILGFLAMNSDRLLLGALVDSDSLGLYAIALLILGAIQSALSKLGSGVALPLFSEVARNDASNLRNVYYRARAPLDAALLFAAGLLFSGGTAIIHALYDNRYGGAGPILEVVGLCLIASRYELVDQCFLALGKPRVLNLPILCRILAFYIIVPLAYRGFGFEGAVWGIAASAFAGVPVSLVLMKRHGLLSLSRELLPLPVFLIGMGCGSLVNLAPRLLSLH